LGLSVAARRSQTMSRLDELPPDQRAALSLLLRQHRTYAQLAEVLGISEQAVHDRAHAALALLAPSLAREVDAERRADIGDYLLDQQDALADRLRTRAHLSSSPPAQAWAQALAAELAPLASRPLPEIPLAAGSGERDAPTVAADTAVRAPRSSDQAGTPATHAGAAARAPDPGRAGGLRASRVGGAVLLALLVAAVVVAVVLISGSGGSKAHKATGQASAAGATATGPSIGARLPLRAPGSNAVTGLVQILAEGSKRAFYVVAEKLPPSNGFFYALWLYNTSTRTSEPLGKAPPVKATGRLEGGGALPANPEQFNEILLTRETSTKAGHPGAAVLRGPFSLTG
jgi:hypothetical protein